MKNLIKIASLVLCLILICMTLCSCMQLDEMKYNHAVFTKDDNSELLFRDNTYKRIDIKDSFIIRNESYDGTVSEPNVPILLASSFGTTICYSRTDETPTILMIPYYDMFKQTAYYNDKGEEAIAFFCLESEYDRLKDISENAQFDHMYIEYYDYNEGADVFNGYYSLEKTELIDKKYQDAIERTIKNKKAEKITSDNYDGVFETVQVTRCDKDIIIAKKDSQIEIMKNDNDYYVAVGTEFNQQEDYYITTYQKASDRDIPIFEELFEKYGEKDIVYD